MANSWANVRWMSNSWLNYLVPQTVSQWAHLNSCLGQITNYLQTSRRVAIKNQNHKQENLLTFMSLPKWTFLKNTLKLYVNIVLCGFIIWYPLTRAKVKSIKPTLWGPRLYRPSSDFCWSRTWSGKKNLQSLGSREVNTLHFLQILIKYFSAMQTSIATMENSVEIS